MRPKHSIFELNCKYQAYTFAFVSPSFEYGEKRKLWAHSKMGGFDNFIALQKHPRQGKYKTIII